MKRIRIMGLCLVAVFAFSALVAASASAMEVRPTYKTCIKVKETGKFNLKNCTGASKGGKKEGDYELAAWNAGKSVKFTGKNGVSTLTSYIKGFGIVGAVSCKSAKDVGAETGPSSSEVVAEFKTCTSSGEKCASPGQKAGTIKTDKLVGLLGLNGAKEGQIIEKVSGAGPGGQSAEFSCGEEHISTTGSVDAEQTKNLTEASKESGTVFAVNAGGENVINSEEEEAGTQVLLTEVTGVGTFESGENTTSALKGEVQEVEA